MQLVGNLKHSVAETSRVYLQHMKYEQRINLLSIAVKTSKKFG
jgi:hypothetical protein